MATDSYSWRDAQPGDLRALEALDDACFEADGPELIEWFPYPELLNFPGTTAVCTNQPGDQIVAVAWVRITGSQTRLGGKVHPQHRRRKLGAQAVRWAEAQSSKLGGPAALIIRNEAFNEGAGALYARCGYATDFIERWMTRGLGEPLPDLPLQVTLSAWSDHNAQQFYDTFLDSFQDRGGIRESAQTWIAAYRDDQGFRPDLCLLAFLDGEPVAFVTAGFIQPPRSDEPIGFISQIGVRPAWRRSGIADGLIGTIARQVRQEGLNTIGLDVNVNNPRAIRLYERLEFTVVGRRAKFSKTLSRDG